jgi:bifunctional non-homologous end joining protein LigD
MLLLKTDAPSDSALWQYQLKLDGYRAIAFKTGGNLHLRSRNNKDFALRYPAVVAGLAKLPDEAVIDGDVVAFDEDGKPSFNALQNYGTAPAPVVFYVFDVMVLAGKDVMSEPLDKRQKLLETKVLPKLKEPCRYAGSLDAKLSDLVSGVYEKATLLYVARTRNGFTRRHVPRYSRSLRGWRSRSVRSRICRSHAADAGARG